MYMGRVVEMAGSEDLFKRPLHPYTQTLLTAIPKLELFQKWSEPGEKEAPLSLHLERGCSFQPRCIHERDRCRVEEPVLQDAGDDHWVACHFF
jgi:peptide/nickel transport system ATP-binding protein